MDNIRVGKPDFIYEAAQCLFEAKVKSLEDLISKHEKFGLTRIGMENMFRPLKSYFDAVSAEILPIYDEYPELSKYFTPFSGDTGSDCCVAAGIAHNLCEFGKAGTLEQLDRIISEELNDLSGGKLFKNGEYFSSLSELLNAVLKVNIDESAKMIYLSLYADRETVIPRMSELLQRCAAVCEKHFDLVSSEYDSFLSDIKKIGSLGEYLEKSIGLKLKDADSFVIIPSVFGFSSLFLCGMKTQVYRFGIYVLRLEELKKNAGSDDARLVSDLKALGDASRFKIIRLLSEKPMYAQELAERLGLTAATMSHHIGLLLSAQLISITLSDSNDKIILYRVNSERLALLGERIAALGQSAEPQASV